MNSDTNFEALMRDCEFSETEEKGAEYAASLKPYTLEPTTHTTEDINAFFNEAAPVLGQCGGMIDLESFMESLTEQFGLKAGEEIAITNTALVLINGEATECEYSNVFGYFQQLVPGDLYFIDSHNQSPAKVQTEDQALYAKIIGAAEEYADGTRTELKGDIRVALYTRDTSVNRVVYAK